MIFGQNIRKHVEIGGYKLNPGLRGKCTLQNPDLTTHTHAHTDRDRDEEREGEREIMKVERVAADRQRCVSGKNNR